MLILHHNSFQVLFDKIVYVYFIWKIYTTLVSEMASVGNQHCAICIGTVLVPYVWCSVMAQCWFRMSDAVWPRCWVVYWRLLKLFCEDTLTCPRLSDGMYPAAYNQLLTCWLIRECCSDYLLSLSQVVVSVATRADFHRATLATTAGEKLIVGCRPLRN